MSYRNFKVRVTVRHKGADEDFTYPEVEISGQRYELTDASQVTAKMIKETLARSHVKNVEIISFKVTNGSSKEGGRSGRGKERRW